MNANEIEAVLGRRFQLERPPTLLVQTAAKTPIVFTRLRSKQALRGRSMSVPREEAFAFQVPLAAPFFSRLWVGGKFKALPAAAPGDLFLFDLADNPTVGLDTSFDTLRFYISQTAIDDLAYEQGLRRVGGLRAPSLGHRDPVLYGLAQTLAAAMEQPSVALFNEYIALAFHQHVIHAYGNAPIRGKLMRGGLAPRELRRVNEYIDANLDGDVSVAKLARICGLSGSHFARAFKQTTGMPPHQWLTHRRLEQAKRLLQDSDLDLAEIALICGFMDQGHFTRVFSTRQGKAPGRWRRLRRM